MNDEQIIKSGKLSPGLIDGVVHEFLAHSSGQYYYRPKGADAYLKTDGKFKLLPSVSVLHARSEYLAIHLEDEMTVAINLEFQTLGKGLVQEAKGLIDYLDEKIRWSKPAPENSAKFSDMEQSIFKQADQTAYTTKKAEATAWVQSNPTAELLLKQLRTACTDQDFETLYALTGKKEQPLLISRNTATDQVLKRMFSAGAIEKTIEELNNNGTLYLRAKVNVEKRYFS